MPKRLPPTLESLSADTQAFYEIVSQEADVAAALIGASYLDQCLGSTLRRRLKPGKVTDALLDASGALGTFAARIDLSYALGSFTDVVHADLRTIARVRNLFAHHHLTLTFSDADVSTQCAKLRYIASMATSDGPALFREALAHPRDRFVLTVTMLSQHLMVGGLGATLLHTAT